MITEKSCGAIVFTRERGHVLYLIIESTEGIFGFPKGHVEGEETEHETARREVGEETGLTVEFVGDFRVETSHPFQRGGETRMKHVVYFLAEFAGQEPKPQEEELNGIRLMRYEEAIASLQFEDSREILRRANLYLQEWLRGE